MSKGRKRKNKSSPKAALNARKSQAGKSKLAPRNPLAQNPLMKKSHAHQKSNKAKRSQEKQQLRKQLAEE